MTEYRYLVCRSYKDDSLFMAHIWGERKSKVVIVAPSQATDYLKTMKVSKWDSLPKSPVLALINHAQTSRAQLDAASEHLKRLSERHRQVGALTVDSIPIRMS